METWKVIDGYDGNYLISNFGSVKSIKNPLKIIFLKQEKIKGGYLRVSLSKKSKVKRFRVHRLVVHYFIGVIDKEKEVNHLDKNPSNNKVSNLEVISRRENSTHRDYGDNENTGIHKLKNSNTYQVKIYFNGKNIYLGSSTDINEAKKIYKDFVISNNIKNKYICH